MSQGERILARLNSGEMCAMEPLDWEPRIYRVAARIKDLRDDGYPIRTKVCRRHIGGQAHALYELVNQDQAVLF